MTDKVKFKIFSIIENILGKNIDGNQKISELVSNDTYKINDILTILKEKFVLSLNDLDNLSINQIIDKINNDKSLEKNTVVDQQFLIWCEKYMTCKYNNEEVVNYLKELDFSEKNIQLFKEEIVNIEIKKICKNEECKEWLIKISIDLYEKYRLIYPLKLLSLKKQLDKNELIIENTDNVNIQEYFKKEDIIICDCYWNCFRQSIFNLDVSQINNNKLIHIEIINKSDTKCIKYLEYLNETNNKFHNLYNIIKENSNSLPKYKYFEDPLKPIIHINDNGYIDYQENKAEFENYYQYLESIIDKIKILNISKDNCIKNDNYTRVYHDILFDIIENGLNEIDKNIILVDINEYILTSELLKSFLMCGCNIILGITDIGKIKKYKNLYNIYGAKNSKLILIPFNLNNSNDLKNFITYSCDYFNNFIDTFIPLFNQTDTSCILSEDYIHQKVLLLFNELQDQYEKNEKKGRHTKILIPFIPNVNNFLNNTYYSIEINSFNNFIYKLSIKYGSFFLFTSINCGWIREKKLSRKLIIAPEIEKAGITTLVSSEIALYIISLLHNNMKNIFTNTLISLDISFGLFSFENLSQYILEIEKRINEQINYKILLNSYSSKNTVHLENEYLKSRYSFTSQFPTINKERCKNLKINDLPIEKNNVIVIVGFGENSFYGSSRTRLMIEKDKNISLESCIEICWYMGLIEYEKKFGWKDIKENIYLDEYSIYNKYESIIVDRLNISTINKYDKSNLFTYHIINNDLEDIIINNGEEIEFLKKKYQDKIVFYKKENDIKQYAKIIKGTEIVITNSIKKISSIQKNNKIYGIPEELLNKMDRDTLYTIVAASEALISAGISDPYEIYQYISISDVGCVIGQGNKSIPTKFEKDLNKESIINTTISYWINKVLLNFQGPTKIPDSGYNAYAMSMEMGIELLQQQKAKIVFVGSSDHCTVGNKNFEYPFEENASSILMITNAALAIEMGLPIYGICGYVHSSLKLSELKTIFAENINIDKKSYDYFNWKNRKKSLDEIIKNLPDNNPDLITYITKFYGHDFYKNNEKVSHIMGALSTWGLNIDDITIGVYNNFFYERKIKDSSVIQKQMEYLGRNSGNLLPVVMPNNNISANSSCFGFLINSLLQSFQTGNITINNNWDNIDYSLSENKNLYYPNGNFKMNFIKSILLKNISEDNNTCVELLLIHPDYLLGTLTDNELNIYLQKFEKKKYINFRIWDNVIYNMRPLIHFKKNIVQVHVHSYFDSILNFEFNSINNKSKPSVENLKIFIDNIEYQNNENKIIDKIDLAQIFQLHSKKNIDNNSRGVGIELKLNNDISNIKKNIFTEAEILNCNEFIDKEDRLSRIWAGKESIIKALKSVIDHEEYDIDFNMFKLNEIEIITRKNTQVVNLYNNIKNFITQLNVKEIYISINHSKLYSVAHTIIL